MSETKAEMVVLGGAAVLCLVLLLTTRKPTGGVMDAFTITPATAETGPASFKVDAVAPPVFNYGGSSFTVGGPTIDFMPAGVASSCSCNGMDAATVFGSPADLGAYLTQSGTIADIMAQLAKGTA